MHSVCVFGQTLIVVIMLLYRCRGGAEFVPLWGDLPMGSKCAA